MNTIYNLYKKYQSYIIVVFLTISITSLVMKGSSDTSFVENFNFASTITSIILSVIAIFLTLIDSEKYSMVINNIIDATKNVEESTNNLNDAKVTIEEFISKFNETEKNILNGTKEYISIGMKEAVMDMVKESAITKEFDLKLENDNISLDFNHAICDSPYNIRQYYLFIYESYKANKFVNIYDFNNFFNERLIEDDLSGWSIVEGLITTLFILKGLKFIRFDFSDFENLRIDYIDNSLEKAINESIPNRDSYADSPDFRYFGSVHAYFDKINK